MKESSQSRYVRQEIFEGIGPEGQADISAGRVAIIGLSGLGTTVANHLARAGVGFIRIIDGDYPDLIELQRQDIFTERDAREELPKAVATKDYLEKVNSEIEIDAVISDVNSANIDHMIEDVDLVIDGTDSMELRLLINEACHALQKPWIYGGALAASDTTCNFLPGKDKPCFKCFVGEDIYEEEGEQPTCATVGVLSSTLGMIASLQATEALRILAGSPDVREEMIMFDLWENSFDSFPIDHDPDCPVCAHENYEFYGKAHGSQTVSMCGKDSVQVIPEIDRNIDFAAYARKLEKQGKVSYNEYTLNFDDGTIGIKLFKNGRAIIKHVNDISRAKAAYAEYIGI